MSNAHPSGLRRSVSLGIALVAALVLVFAFSLGAFAQTVVYDNIPNPMPPNIPSYGFQSVATYEMGGHVQLATTNRKLESVTILMSSWACESGVWGPTCLTTTPNASFPHEITLTLYQAPSPAVQDAPVGAVIGTWSKVFDIPYRPSADPLCTGADAGKYKGSDGTCNNGIAFQITFDNLLVGGSSITLPDELAWGIAYNTGSYGANPTGNHTAGYNSLNLGTNPAPSVGTEPNPGSALWDSTYSGRTRGFTLDLGWAPYVPAAKIMAANACTTDCYVDATTGNDANHGTAAYPKQTIQAGVAAVQAGGTVHVADGTYAEVVTVNKALSLLAESHATVINGGIAVLALVNDVTIDGFTVQGGFAPDPSTFAGIYVTGGVAPNSSNITVTNNVIVGPGRAVSPGNGIEIGYAISNLEISHNVIEKWRYGIYHNPSVNSGNEIHMNTIRDVHTGVVLDGPGAVSVHNNLFELPIDFSAVGHWQWNNVVQPGVNVFANSFPAGAHGVSRRNQSNLGAGPNAVHAAGNWWGGVAGPGVPNATIDIQDGGVVISSPWLEDGTNLVNSGPGFIPNASLWIEDGTGFQNATLSIPIMAMAVTPFTGGTVDFTYDPAKVQILGVTQGSSLTGWGFFVNLDYGGTGDTVRVTFANATEVAPAGAYELAVISVKLLATPGNTATLNVVTSDLDFNLSPTPVPDQDGTITIVGDMLSGTVRDWGVAPLLGVENVLLTLKDNANLLPTLTDLTDAAGAYSIGPVFPGNYTLTPSFGLQVCPLAASCAPKGISGNDASLVLQHHAGLSTLSGFAAIAAEVNGDNIMNTVDATLILRRASAMIATWPNSVPLWKFVDPSKTYTFVSTPSNPVNQDFTAILMGDVDGNWDPSLVSAAWEVGDASVSFAQAVTQADGSVSVAVMVNTGNAESVTSLDLDLAYDSSKFVALESSVAGGWLSETNLDNNDTVIHSSATANGVASGTTVVTLNFRPTGSDTNVRLTPSTVFVNGRAARVVDSPLVTPSFRMLIPFVQSAN